MRVLPRLLAVPAIALATLVLGAGPALEVPELLVGDLRAFLRRVR